MSNGVLWERANKGASLQLPWPDEWLNMPAELAWEIAKQRTRNAGGLLTSAQARTYRELSEVERAGLRSAVRDSLAAAMLAGLIEFPDS